MAKKVPMGAKPQRNDNEQSDQAKDNWVVGVTPQTEQNTDLSETQPEKIKRLTIDIPETLHRNFKTSCAARGIKMADILRELIEKDLKKHK